MKILIAHRGNLYGANPEMENNPDYVSTALSLGFDVEIDIWYKDGVLYLGHDKPQYPIDYYFLTDPRLWIHCKNIEAMEYLSEDHSLNLFAHKDDVVITTQGYLWTAPGYPLTSKSIAVMPELAENWYTFIACGVCSDYPVRYQKWT